MLTVCVQAPYEVFRFYRGEKSLCGCKVLFESVVGREVRAGYIDWEGLWLLPQLCFLGLRIGEGA